MIIKSLEKYSTEDVEDVLEKYKYLKEYFNNNISNNIINEYPDNIFISKNKFSVFNHTKMKQLIIN
ncbi:hypothetical protein FYJ83_01445 [Tissierella sp. DSM 105185]|uniref:Uncharacterized protein n=2 Tax=Tissierella pigra TaxID=2607614 RepID=A0A6N7XDL2_9FIRM|nr:hypothetical protein [Tissierella pigra]